MLELINKEDCSTKGGTRRSDRIKFETNKKGRLTTKQMIKKINGRKYRYLLYWDKEQSRMRTHYLGKVE